MQDLNLVDVGRLARLFTYARGITRERCKSLGTYSAILQSQVLVYPCLKYLINLKCLAATLESLIMVARLLEQSYDSWWNIALKVDKMCSVWALPIPNDSGLLHDSKTQTRW